MKIGWRDFHLPSMKSGKARILSIVPMALDFERHVLGGMPADERDLLFRLLDRLDELELRAETETAHD